MRSAFAARVPTLWHGQGVAPRLSTQFAEGRETLVIADSGVAIPALPGRGVRTIEVDARAVDVTTVVELAAEIARRPPNVIVAIGGGSVLDASKIAALALAPGGVLDYVIARASKSALVFLPDAPPPVDIVAVPTTLGTSSETNSVAILKNEYGYRLVCGRSLRPRHAVIDSDNLMTLSPTAVREGALEAFLRLAGAATSSRRSRRGDSDAVAIGRALLSTAARDTASPAARLRLARLSALTQRSAALRGEDPYSARHWYVANEVAFALGVRKMVATVAVIAPIWRRICAGDARWGDHASLERFWREAAGVLVLPLDPSRGISALIDQWEISLPRRPTAHEFGAIALATQKRWGHRYPMLPGLVEEDFRDVLRDSRWSQLAGAASTDFRRPARRR
ncbi:iron-containing alcohol dehydrogenase [Microbacterium sp. SSW1-49]|uniref:Iron-containing alcohol dehydrogenase n=1 Tax=Microbacterium croceum TaxID=2851645 RepID=A0ABT0FIT6_9MICO|nr:daptide-type RiPP biosynthesis dehydogenase [Microbacterium croceum]MCK2037637.1 iron-containing alcohol dehydrogenase [Microbacterium croceum]